MRAENTQQVVSAEHGRKIESSLDGRKVPWSPQFHYQIPDTLSLIFFICVNRAKNASLKGYSEN